jgi:hypothetical protein
VGLKTPSRKNILLRNQGAGKDTNKIEKPVKKKNNNTAECEYCIVLSTS